jgi:hypothetical protein
MERDRQRKDTRAAKSMPVGIAHSVSSQRRVWSRLRKLGSTECTYTVADCVLNPRDFTPAKVWGLTFVIDTVELMPYSTSRKSPLKGIQLV